MRACPDATGNPYCVDVNNDPNNCGGCHITCMATQSCVQGKCG
jgi:hypothetical protein